MEKYKKYEINDIEQTMEDICFPKEVKRQLLPQQAFLGDYLYDNMNVNGLLVYHEIGSGKTCTAITIAEKFKNELSIIVVLPASLIYNFRNELRSECGNNNYITMQEKEMLSQYNPGSKEYNEIIQSSDMRIDKVYTIYSYHLFIKQIDRGLINLENTLLIIDEVQNMVSISGTFYKTLLATINIPVAVSKIILLSATPIFDNPVEIGLTLNLLRPKIHFPVGDNFEGVFFEKVGNYWKARNIPLFKDMCKGLISYYSGALPISYPKKNFKVIRCNMNTEQLATYTIARKKELVNQKKFKGSMKFPMNFLLGSRIVSNVAFPNKLAGEEGFSSLKNGLANIENFSIKFDTIYKKILESNGPVFVYSAFLDYGGLRSFAFYLEYKGYTLFNKFKQNNKCYAIYSGDSTIEMREMIKTYFNMKENTNGKVIKILLGSPSTKEGISLFRVKQVHIMEPHWNLSRIKQIIGRAVRFCSHKDLPESERYVDVYLYLATHISLKHSIDEYVWSIAKRKYRLIKEFEMALKEVAIDCKLFNKINNLSNFNKLTCDN
jgi:hypothetical protein